ncbi:hypothetical protein ACIBI8_37620 [Streptomyces sp. NPDC050529]|uniref:hypothetical protein n=1 Tax=Streptomyces sp. NPDC050529 TaxID=3365624 RepID=UPI00378E7E49
MSDVAHVVPVGDAVQHDTVSVDADCVCGPETQPVEQESGGIGWLIVHHALDGREGFEGSAA